MPVEPNKTAKRSRRTGPAWLAWMVMVKEDGRYKPVKWDTESLVGFETREMGRAWLKFHGCTSPTYVLRRMVLRCHAQ